MKNTFGNERKRGKNRDHTNINSKKKRWHYTIQFKCEIYAGKERNLHANNNNNPKIM